ncbi:hypothetical protein OEZ85_004879 [Tetradesmus obliquus]|uniref:Uncharacterized protein n=1 Tax=Tetradesmus obliquus TaxID=3088 RepID=A0ABY8UGI6_TETOB|nr:hypothetical protein OEZ85_004879 [Tetradesmus obliquus]
MQAAARLSGPCVGDANKRGVADVPIFVGVFDVAVTAQQQQARPSNASWVLGWTFTAGEHLQQPRDVFGDDGISDVYLSGQDQAAAQGVAVFSNSSLAGPQAEATFSFVGRKGPKTDASPAAAPFSVAPPTALFLNNHYCWPLLRHSGSIADPASAANAAGNASGLSRAAAASGMLVGLDGQQQQQHQWPAVAAAQLPADAMPKDLLVEYLPVEFTEAGEDGALFAKNLTQFYFRLSNRQPASSPAPAFLLSNGQPPSGTAPVFLDQIVLQYWFQGPEEPTAASAAALAAGDGSSRSNSSSGAGAMQQDWAVAALVASQFKMSCSDATPAVGCGGIAWSVSDGLFDVFGARFVLNIWFPQQQDKPRVLLLPNGTAANSSAAATFITEQLLLQQQRKQQQQQQQQQIVPLEGVEGILLLSYRRFFSSINARDDYSFLDTPLVPSSSSSSGGSGKPIVRRQREANSQLPAYWVGQLAWGSPPVAKKAAVNKPSGGAPAGASSSGSTAAPVYPPGSYCQRPCFGFMLIMLRS